MDVELIRLVWQRAKGCCEYCQLFQESGRVGWQPHRSRRAGRRMVGLHPTLLNFRCNSFKGSDISGRDRRTRKLTPLFNPRRYKWATHFRWQGAYLIGRTPVGRVTVALLQINDDYRVELREGLIEEGVFPPT
jgi:hypothetical protein